VRRYRLAITYSVIAKDEEEAKEAFIELLSSGFFAEGDVEVESSEVLPKCNPKGCRLFLLIKKKWGVEKPEGCFQYYDGYCERG